MQVSGLLKTARTTVGSATRYVREVLPLDKVAPVKAKIEKVIQRTELPDRLRDIAQPYVEKLISLEKIRCRHLAHSLNPKVAEIEKSLLQQGIHARFANDYELASIVEKGLAELKKEGFDVPKDILVQDLVKGRTGEVPQFRKKTASKSPLVLSKDYVSLQKEELIINKETYAKHKVTASSASTMAGSIFHENCHWLHFHNIPDEKTCVQIWSSANKKKIAEEVSVYAIDRKRNNGIEFVAEVFAGLMEGKRYSEYVMGIYKQLNGPMPKSLLQETQKLDKVV